MNHSTRWLVGVVVVGMLAGAGFVRAEGAASACYIVKIIGSDRKATLEILPEAEFKALEKTIKLEQKYFSKAVSLAAKDWREDKLNKGAPFPGAMLKPRTIMTSQKFPTMEKGGEQMTKLESMEAKKAERLTEQEKKNTTKKGASSPKDPKKGGDLSLAADLVKAKLDALISGTGGEPGAAVQAEGGAKVEAGGAKVEAGAAKPGADVKKGKGAK